MEGYGVKKVRLIKKRIFGKGHQMTCVLQPQREREREIEKEREREREREREKERERERMKGGGRKKTWRNVMWATKVHRRLGTMSLRMTCVISFYYGNSHTHCGKRLGTIILWKRKNTTLLYRDAFTHRHFYTQTLSHTEAFTHRNSCTYRRFYRDTFSHRRFYTQTLSHTDAFMHRPFYTQRFLHTDAFTHRGFFLHTETPFTHGRLHRDF